MRNILLTLCLLGALATAACGADTTPNASPKNTGANSAEIQKNAPALKLRRVGDVYVADVKTDDEANRLCDSIMEPDGTWPAVLAKQDMLGIYLPDGSVANACPRQNPLA